MKFWKHDRFLKKSKKIQMKWLKRILSEYIFWTLGSQGRRRWLDIPRNEIKVKITAPYSAVPLSFPVLLAATGNKQV
jgi:hypothetical protein